MGAFQPPSLPPEHVGRYRVLVVDCPWQYDNQKTGGSHTSGAVQKYPTMSLQELMAMRRWVLETMAENSVCFMWATNPLMPEAFFLLSAWLYRYKTMLTWHKSTGRLGMGYWFRGETEHLLFGVRGDVPAFRSSIRNWFAAPVGRHSEKPDAFYEHIEPAIADLSPRLEIFARKPRPGWSTGL